MITEIMNLNKHNEKVKGLAEKVLRLEKENRRLDLLNDDLLLKLINRERRIENLKTRRRKVSLKYEQIKLITQHDKKKVKILNDIMRVFKSCNSIEREQAEALRGFKFR